MSARQGGGKSDRSPAWPTQEGTDPGLPRADKSTQSAPELTAQGLYDPALDKDSCGVGFIADIKGRKSQKLVEDALAILCNLEHRGAVGAVARARATAPASWCRSRMPSS